LVGDGYEGRPVPVETSTARTSSGASPWFTIALTALSPTAMTAHAEVGSSPELEHHRDQMQPLDRLTHGRAVLCQLGEDRADGHP
jgi:hypothetical protein